MKKIFLITTIFLLIGCAYAQNSTIAINNVEFKIPEKYQGGELNNGKYQLDNVFSIRCIDDNPMKVIGLWAEESDYSNDLTIGNHPVRYYCQYNQYVHGNQSHAYFASGDSIYEITWTGEEINTDIKNLIKNTPKSNINEDEFYKTLDESIDIYENERIDSLNSDAEYNYLESKFNSQSLQDTGYDSNLNEILLTFFR